MSRFSRSLLICAFALFAAIRALTAAEPAAEPDGGSGGPRSR